MSGALSTTGKAIYQLGFELSPIILTGGLAANVPFTMLPIIALTQPATFAAGLIGGNVDLSGDSMFAHFEPMPGAKIISNRTGKYPFANQAVAGNAIIAQELTFSLKMVCPVNVAGGYTAKFVTFLALKAALDIHTQLGGTFTVVTPTAIYLNALLLDLTDISGGESKQSQHTWQWDFEKPLITLQEADGVLNSLMTRISSGTQINGDPTWSGPETGAGVAMGGGTPSVVPTSTNLTGTSAIPTGPGGMVQSFYTSS